MKKYNNSQDSFNNNNNNGLICVAQNDYTYEVLCMAAVLHGIYTYKVSMTWQNVQNDNYIWQLLIPIVKFLRAE